MVYHKLIDGLTYTYPRVYIYIYNMCTNVAQFLFLVLENCSQNSYILVSTLARVKNHFFKLNVGQHKMRDFDVGVG